MRCPLVFVMALVLFPVLSAHADTIHVPADQPTIQAGIDAAANGDTVLVAPGTYVENIDFLGKSIHVKSLNSPNATVIDGGQLGSVVVFKSGEDSDARLEGFTLTNGRGSSISGEFYGGGILCLDHSSPSLIDNRIVDNSAIFGGGICCFLESNPLIANNEISGNTADRNGAGVFCRIAAPIITENQIHGNTCGHLGGGIHCYRSNAVIEGNLISGNTSQYRAGGIHCEYWSPIIKNNTIQSNHAASGAGIFCVLCTGTIIGNIIADNSAAYDGGGICCVFDSDLKIIANEILENRAGAEGFQGSGAGIYCSGSSPLITDNLVAGNIASSSVSAGGGILIESYSSPHLENNRVLGNETSGHGGGIYCQDSASPQIIHCTILGNSAIDGGGGICCLSYCKPMITNSILWGNACGTGPEICIGGGASPTTLLISGSDVQGGLDDAYIYSGSTLNWGPGMIDDDPLFVDASGEDVHLTYLSPCKDTGSLRSTGTDFEGDPRPSFGGVDMGADEFHDHLYFMGDATPGGNLEIRVVGGPLNDVILFLGGDLLDPPLNTKYGKWFLQTPVLPLVMGTTSWQGIATLEVRIPASTPATTIIPMQALVRDRLTNLSVFEIDC